MTNNSTVVAYNLAEELKPEAKTHWYNKSVAFWLITLALAAGMIAATELWLLPIVVGYEFDLSWIKIEVLNMFANVIVEFTKEAAPYTIPVISAILWVRFNLSVRKTACYGIVEYATSIGTALAGIVIAVILTAFTFAVFMLFVVVLGLYLGIKITKWILILS